MGNTNITTASSVANTSSVANASSVDNASSVANVATGANGPHISLLGQMDDANKDALKVLMESGSEAFVKHCFNPTGKKQLTYAEMRSMFG